MLTGFFFVVSSVAAPSRSATRSTPSSGTLSMLFHSSPIVNASLTLSIRILAKINE